MNRPAEKLPPCAKAEELRSPGRTELRAAFYGLALRQQGYSPDEAAAYVAARYPRTRPLLRRLIEPTWREKQDVPTA